MEHNIFPVVLNVSYAQRKKVMNQQPHLVWLTGLSGSGKTTLALELDNYLFEKGFKTFILDGDNIRKGLCSDLDFTEEGRKENLRRIAEAAKLMLDAGLIVICAFISPYQKERALVKTIVGSDRFREVHVSCPLMVCERRDVKGLYAKARQGLIQNFTGISAPYEIPPAPNVEVNTDTESIETSLQKIIDAIEPLLRSSHE